MPIVRVYTTVACPYCYTLKEFLKEHNIEFEDIDISKDEKIKDDIIKRSGAIGAPIIEVDGEIIVGFNMPQIKQKLGLA